MNRVWDHTALSDLRCEELFARRHRDGLTRARDDSASLACGKAIHAGVRAYYAELNEGEIVDATMRAWGRVEPTIDDDWRTLDLALAYVMAYQRAWPRPWPFDVVWNEGYVRADDVAGIPDRAVRRHMDGLVYPFELKTTSLWIGAAWQERWAYSQQAAIQLALLEHELKRPLVGFWMDAVYLSSRKDGPKASDFVRCGPFTYSPALRAELLAQVARDSARANEIVSGTGEPPRPTGVRNGACIAWNRLCQFHRFCVMGPEDREAAYEMARATGELVERRWNPATRGD